MDETRAVLPLSGRALLLEDNAVVALDAEEMLRAIGFEDVDVASSVARALEFLSVHEYAAGVLDLMVRDGSSHAIAEHFLARHVPFVIASGYDASGLSAAMRTAPRISKPYDEGMLRDALRAATAQSAFKP